MGEHYRDRRNRWGGSYKLAHPPGHEAHGHCVYCGATTHGKDHVPPLRIVDALNGQAGELLLYGCCPLCNSRLSAYPAPCLDLRAKHLIAALRAEWLRVRAGLKRRYSLEQVEAAGRGVSARLKDRLQRDLCQCPKCKTPGQ